MTDTIIIATDFSEPARAAVRYGAQLARFLGSDIVLVHAYSLPVQGYETLSPLSIVDDLQAVSMEALSKIKDELIREVQNKGQISCYASVGLLSAVIKEALEKFGGQIVVMGMTGESGFIKKHLIGSNSLDAVRHLTVPLFVIPEHCVFEPVRNILFTCDNAGMDADVPKILRYFAGLMDAEVEILHVQQPEEDEDKSAEAIAAVKQALAPVKSTSLTLQSRYIAETLNDYLENNPFDLVVINPKRRKFLQDLFHSSTTKKLIYTVHKPMLMIR